MRLFVLAAALALPAQAFALSCIEPSVEFSYAAAANSEQSYMISTGRITFDENLMPRSSVDVMLTPPPLTKIPATVRGKMFNGEGFAQEFEAPVELQVHCIGRWCPSFDSTAEHLLFLKEGENRYELALNPCGGRAFAEPTEEMFERLFKCHAEQNCTQAPKPNTAPKQ